MRKIKKGILALCITAGLFSLSACSSSQEETASSLDLNTSTQISMVSESLISQITSIPEEELEGMIAVQEENGEMALAEAMTSWQNVMPDTGAFVKVENSVADKADDEYKALGDVEAAYVVNTSGSAQDKKKSKNGDDMYIVSTKRNISKPDVTAIYSED